MTDAQPLISIILPLHNCASFMEACLKQLDQLDYPSLEIVAVDDGSSDGTGELFAAWAATTGRRTSHHRNDSANGVARARNDALKRASGDFVWFVDSDDAWDPSILADLLRAAQANCADVAVCDAVREIGASARKVAINDAGAGGVIDGPEAFQRMLNGSLSGHLWNKLFKRNFLGSDPFPLQRAHSDLNGLLNLLPKAGTVILVPGVRYRYQVRSGSILQSHDYQPTDLEACVSTARRQVGALTVKVGLHRDLSIFEISSIAIPAFNERIRRGGDLGLPGSVNLITPHALMHLVGRRRLKVAAKALMLKLMPLVYRALYMRFTANRWGDLLRPQTSKTENSAT